MGKKRLLLNKQSVKRLAVENLDGAKGGGYARVGTGAACSAVGSGANPGSGGVLTLACLPSGGALSNFEPVSG
jgi:hypothetical protein